MTILDFSNVYCQMCNHFYFALQCFIYSQENNCETRYLKSKSIVDNDIERKFNHLGLCNFIYDGDMSNKNIIKNTDDFQRKYHQFFGIDFDEVQLSNFIANTFIKSGNFKKNERENTVAIHIRNTDYLSRQFLVFDRNQYLNSAFNNLDGHIDTIEVFSDDINYTILHYGNIIKNRFKNIIYNIGTSDVDDFIKFSCLKNKIIWNSTFSYWAAFIGNIIYENSYKNIITQPKTCSNYQDKITMDPRWRYV